MENKRSSTVRNTMSRRRHRSMVTIGVAVVLLAVVGLFTIISLCFNLTNVVLDNTTQKRKLERFIQPVIMFDPLAFESPAAADPQMLLRSSVWSALLSKGYNELTRDQETGTVLLPKSDVEVQSAKLFGADVKLQHQTFGNEYEMNYYIYNAEKEMYEIQLNAEMSVYTATIMSIAHKGDQYTLEVGYIPPGNLWNTDAEGNVYEPQPDKIMLMELKKVKDGYNIVALRDGPDTQAQPQQPGPQMPQQQPSQPLPEEMESAPEEESSSESTAEALPPVFGTLTASSIAKQESDGTSYGVENVVDGDMETAWMAAGNGSVDEWLQFEASSDQTVNSIQIANGMCKTETLYEQNNRVTKVLLTFSDGTTREETLTGGTFEQRCIITLDRPIITSSVRITILEVEKGTRYNDTCISEVNFY